MDPLCVPLHQLEGLRSLPGISGIQLVAGKVRHLVYKLGVEKASVSGLGLIRLSLEGGESSWIVFQCRGGGIRTSQRQGGYDYGGGHESHPAPHKQLALSTEKCSGPTREAHPKVPPLLQWCFIDDSFPF